MASGETLVHESREACADAELLARVARADREAFAALYDRFAPLLNAVAQRILNNRTDAEDLLHDVFIEVWRKASGYDPERGSVRAWLVTRVRSRALDRLRSLGVARKHGLAPGQREPQEAEAGVRVDGTIDQIAARQAVGDLPSEQREVLMLCYFRGMTQQEVAERVGIPLGTVKSRLGAAVAGLRKRFQSLGDAG